MCCTGSSNFYKEKRSHCFTQHLKCQIIVYLVSDAMTVLRVGAVNFDFFEENQLSKIREVLPVRTPEMAHFKHHATAVPN